VVDELGLVAVADAVRTALARGQMRASIPDFDQAAALVEALRGNVVDPTDLIAAGELLGERTNFLHDIALQQVELLEHLRLLPSYEVRGAAGTGKTFLAMQLARKLKAEGKRVGYFCYNRMLSKFVTRMFESAQWQPRPDVVAEFHKFTGYHYTMPEGAGDHEWQVVAAEKLLAAGLKAGESEKFDAIIVDEAQDFRPLWWEAMSAWLRNPPKGLFVFGDADQGIFASSAVDQLELPKISLNVNLRNPWPVADSAGKMIADPPRALDYDGPPVLFIECAREDAINAADHMVDELFDSWHPGNIVLLTTGHQHPEHQSRVHFHGEDTYERGLWDEDAPFYATVGKFKGLERPVVVIAVDDFREGINPADVLYVALTRATHAAVICGDPQEITAIVGAAAMAGWERRQYIPD
jgi:UvrD-like helicase C-terminal domain/AAA domain